MHARGFDHVVWAVRDLDAAAHHLARLGFTVTPRARHPWGTENRLVQLDGFFIELLTVGEGADISEPTATEFSFGAFNRDFLARREGASMLVLESADPARDRAEFEAAGLPVFAPFHFGREQTRPDGSLRKVGFELTFTGNADDPRHGFFTCLNRYPENFWSPAFQVHDNGAAALAAVIVVCEQPADQHIFYAAFTGEREMRATSLGITITTPRGDLRLMPPGAYAALFGETVALAAPDASRIAALVFSGCDREALARRLDVEGVDHRPSVEGLVVPADRGFGLSLVFA